MDIDIASLVLFFDGIYEYKEQINALNPRVHGLLFQNPLKYLHAYNIFEIRF
jgi:hypothetical protein